MKNIAVKEGDFAICLSKYFILRRPRSSTDGSDKAQGARKIKFRNRREIEILMNIRRETNLCFMGPCLNGKKFALLLAKKKRMNLLLIVKSGSDFAIYRFIDKKSRELFCGFLFFVVIFNND